MTRLIGCIFIVLMLVSCKESEQDRISRLVNEWNGKIVKFPDSICFTSYRNDTVMTKYTRDKTAYTILNYVDTIGCISCRLQLSRWKEMMKELDSICPNKVNCLMVFNPKEKNKLIKHIKHNEFNYFVYIDEENSLNSMNNFLSEENFCTFLLDEDDRIIAIGNPILRPSVRKLYFNIISGETAITPISSQHLTTVSLSNSNINFGNFSWKEKKNACISLTNKGDIPLVINDVISSCGCIKVEYNKSPVRPGKSITLNIIYQAEHPEYFDKTITIFCNIENSILQLKVSGNAE